VGYRIFTRAICRDMSAWLLPTALATEKGSALASVALLTRIGIGMKFDQI
jgi:hypothetical protein